MTERNANYVNPSLIFFQLINYQVSKKLKLGCGGNILLQRLGNIRIVQAILCYSLNVSFIIISLSDERRSLRNIVNQTVQSVKNTDGQCILIIVEGVNDQSSLTVQTIILLVYLPLYAYYYRSIKYTSIIQGLLLLDYSKYRLFSQ